jgi:arylsulfatase A-like enzyme
VLLSITALCVATSAFAAKEISVPANQPYVDTGLDVKKGEILRITATGEIEISDWAYFGRDGYDWRVSPLGSFRCEKSAKVKTFPLPVMQKGPAPCYCLIGKIGEKGAPFFVGKDYRGAAKATGRLFLGINDVTFTDNKGAFTAAIARGEEARPIEQAKDDIVFSAKELPPGAPAADANVALLYVDGLRYDVLREMAEAGHLPTIKSLFFDGGVDFVNAFTVFPSSTLASNSTLYTGVFLNRSGIKGNNYFDRKRRKGDSYLKPFGPPVAAEKHRPTGVHRLGVELKKLALRPFPRAYKRYTEKRKADVPLLENHLSERGMRYYTTAQPILSQSPPDSYEVDSSTVIPPFQFHNAADYMDEVHARFAKGRIVRDDARVMNFWFPSVDSACHDAPRAQFGGGRKSLALLDKWVSGIVDELKKKKMWDKTYMILFADHGTMGGEHTILQKVDLGRDFFYKPIEQTTDGRMAGDSGMGCNVRWYDDAYRRKGRKRKGYVFIDYAEGVSRVYLPCKDVDSGKWLDRNNLYDLTHYKIAPGMKEIDLIERLLAWDMRGRNLFPETVPDRPIGQILVKLDSRRIAVFGQDGAQAIIERKPAGDNRFTYRYVPAHGITCTADGVVAYAAAESADPFGYLKAGIPLSWLKEYRGERGWLEQTKYLQYPDAVVAIANQMFWDGRMAERERRYSPDMMLCANRGWSFEKPDEPSGGHGYLLYESTHIPFLVTGPNVRKGIIISDAVRTADLVPTVLSLVGMKVDETRFDGRGLSGFLMGEGEKEITRSGASAKEILARLPYEEEKRHHTDLVMEYQRRLDEKRPAHLAPDGRYKGHDWDNPMDIHNVAADVFGVLNREILADFDNVIDLAVPGDKKRPIHKGLDRLAEGYDKIPDSAPKERVRELFRALRIREVTIGEVPSAVFANVTGVAGRGTIYRATLLIKWLENVFSDMDRLILYPVRDKNIKAVSNVNYGLAGVRITLQKLSWGLTHYLGSAVYEGIMHVEKFNEKVVRGLKGQDGPVTAPLPQKK